MARHYFAAPRQRHAREAAARRYAMGYAADMMPRRGVARCYALPSRYGRRVATLRYVWRALLRRPDDAERIWLMLSVGALP